MFSEPTVVVPWDFSQHSQCALNFVLKNASAAKIHVVCVLERPDPYTFGAIWGDQAEEHAHENCVDQFNQMAGDTKHPDLEFVVEFGDPATEVVRYAKEVNADVIVISTHGRTGVKRLMLGSVAHKVSQLASCPVVLLPNDWFESATEQPSATTAAPD